MADQKGRIMLMQKFGETEAEFRARKLAAAWMDVTEKWAERASVPLTVIHEAIGQTYSPSVFLEGMIR